ncbi:Integrase-like protein [Gossypium australe]|uniref:Integrase-like protein n=1 Tax=Gossypium australe TaxID=47621 RepID=A0A5B6VLX1_9ROSI|nr:Integrase-like protein [Gossypium australe]
MIVKIDLVLTSLSIHTLDVSTSGGGQVVGVVAKESTNHRQQQQIQDPPPPAVVNVPRNNSFYCDVDNNALRDQLAPQIPTNDSEGLCTTSLDMVQDIIARPLIIANNFKIKPAMIKMIQNNLQFSGIMTENPNQHLKRFI